MTKKEQRASNIRRLEEEMKGYNRAFYRAFDANDNKIMLQVIHEEQMKTLQLVLALAKENSKILEEIELIWNN